FFLFGALFNSSSAKASGLTFGFIYEGMILAGLRITLSNPLIYPATTVSNTRKGDNKLALLVIGLYLTLKF
ncbi:hypothetical protein, partial [Klebsiella pneumoniae]|uniref:hypothetical protein n=1 Tax=Klebsiella pneumoniae TaxID=573 RepID=UPI0039687846